MTERTASPYEPVVALSERVTWLLDDVMREEDRLDFRKPFLPESLAGTRGVVGITDAERLRLNHVRGNAYLHLFTFVEEYIIATTVQHASAEIFGDEWAVRALLRFGDEEVKHQQLFRRFAAAFARDFGSPCACVPDAAAVASVILTKAPMAVMLATLHLELVTQAHYTDSVRLGTADEDLEPLFASMLRHHWIEEAQHAKIDILELQKLTTMASPEACAAAIDDYLDILKGLDGVLDQQRELDWTSFCAAIGRSPGEDTRASFIRSQRAAYRSAFLLRGLEHRAFREEVAKLDRGAFTKLDAVAHQLRDG